MIDLDAILERVKSGDPVGAAYRLIQQAGDAAPGRMFYEAGSVALSRREDLGGDAALRFARIAFEEAVERDPALAEAHHDLATTMRELGMAEDAVAHYQQALELLPDDADSLIGLGAAQCDTGQIAEAVSSLHRAAEAHPENGRAFANLGVALEAAGREEAAVGAYAKAVARFDAELTEAQDDEAAAEASARRRWARIQHAELLERLGRWPQAIAEFRRLYEEEQAIAEAEEAAEESEEQESDEAAGTEGKPHAVLADAPAPLPEGGAGETLLDSEESAETNDSDGEDGTHSEEEESGRIGLERLFARMIQAKRIDMAFLVLDELGGELAEPRTRATYTLYDPGDGLQTIMVEHWDSGERERLDPAT